MNRLRVLPLALAIAGCSATAGGTPGSAPGGALHEYSATDGRVHVLGRRATDSAGAIEFGASGVTFLTRFRGTGMAARLGYESPDSAGHDWFTVVVDGGAPTRFRTERGTRWYPLAEGLPAGVPTLALCKATEGGNGHDRLVSLRTEELLPADPLPDRRIEFIGNSITAGYGADTVPVPCREGTWYDKTHSWMSYGPRLARRLDAQWLVSAVSGIGMLRNWNSPGPVMPRVYGGLYVAYGDTLTAWDFSRYTPDLVTIALGTNDFSRGAGPDPRPALDGPAFVQAYTRFVGTVRGHYPDARILLLTSPMLDTAENDRLAGYLGEVIENRKQAGDAGISMFRFRGRYTSGCDGHPDLREQGEMTDELEPVVRSLMGW
jgi:lysophospholipase L1-like esterase